MGGLSDKDGNSWANLKIASTKARDISIKLLPLASPPRHILERIMYRVTGRMC